MKRRDANLALVSLGAFAVTRARARPRPMARLGLLATFPPSVPAAAPLWNPFFAELTSRGWSEGRNLDVEGRHNEGQPSRDAALAAELLATRPDVILATRPERWTRRAGRPPPCRS